MYIFRFNKILRLNIIILIYQVYIVFFNSISALEYSIIRRYTNIVYYYYYY